MMIRSPAMMAMLMMTNFQHYEGDVCGGGGGGGGVGACDVQGVDGVHVLRIVGGLPRVGEVLQCVGGGEVDVPGVDGVRVRVLLLLGGRGLVYHGGEGEDGNWATWRVVLVSKGGEKMNRWPPF